MALPGRSPGSPMATGNLHSLNTDMHCMDGRFQMAFPEMVCALSTLEDFASGHNWALTTRMGWDGMG